MLRRYQSLADSVSGQLVGWRRFACCVGIGVACVAAAAAAGPSATAASTPPRTAPQALWKAFPLNPTGERLLDRSGVAGKAIERGRASAVGKPLRDAVSAGSRTNIVVFALVAGFGSLGLLALVWLAAAQLLYTSARARWMPATLVHGAATAVGEALGWGTRRLTHAAGVPVRRVVAAVAWAPRRVGRGIGSACRAGWFPEVATLFLASACGIGLGALIAWYLT